MRAADLAQVWEIHIARTMVEGYSSIAYLHEVIS